MRTYSSVAILSVEPVLSSKKKLSQQRADIFASTAKFLLLGRCSDIEFVITDVSVLQDIVLALLPVFACSFDGCFTPQFFELVVMHYFRTDEAPLKV